MLTTNPFAELSASIPPAIMQAYVVVMIVLVVGGTLLDMVHKKSARYFFDNWRKVKDKGRRIGGGETISLAVQTAAIDVATSAEFCSQPRRIAHLLGMYGFLLYVVTAAIMVFAYPTPADPGPTLLATLWYVGALMICVSGYWFWFFIRVDVAAEGNPPFRFVRADLFIVTLMASATLGLIWAWLQTGGYATAADVLLGLYLIATTVLFVSIPWSKFSHMFYKPAAAFQKRVEQANGTRRGLPAPVNAPATLGSGRRLPRNY
ncbi:MAG: hypothetical protein WBF58_24105 [Xanthobacteraceae bacterium]